MKKRIYIALMVFASAAMIFNSCKKSELEELYPDPGKSSTATVENYLTGLMASANEVVLPWYWRFFVVEQPTMGHYTQTMGWLNGKDQYIPPAQAMDWRWEQYYNNVMTNYRVMEVLYGNLTESAQAEYRIFMLAAKIFFYDQTQQMVDLFGSIPWSEAGKIRQIGNLDEALPKYDDGKEIYDAMIADLASIADELSEIQVPTFYAGLFKAKDFMNNGNVVLWQKYCNSLRLRMLLRVSDVEADAGTKIAAILSNPSKYPVIEGNADAIMHDAGGPDMYATTSSKTGGIRQAMETWGQYDIAPYAVVKYMVDNNDPRLNAMFDPNKNGDFVGLDPLLDATVQNTKLSENMVSRYDTSSFTRNNLFPGFIITAAEVSFMKAEAYQRGWAAGDAKAAYEKGVEQSVELYFNINGTGDYRAPLAKPTAGDITAYLNKPAVKWDGNADKLGLIATQKWLNTGLAQLPQTWAECRRFDKPVFTFPADPTSQQAAPPVRWLYPQTEKDLNGANYAAVKSQDDLNVKIFWDTK